MILTSFLVGLALVLAGTAFAAIRGIGLWRTAKSTSAAFSDEFALFEERTARTERLLAEADASSRNLELALERLRVSQARLNVLRASVEHARGKVAWLRPFLPL